MDQAQPLLPKKSYERPRIEETISHRSVKLKPYYELVPEKIIKQLDRRGIEDVKVGKSETAMEFQAQ